MAYAKNLSFGLAAKQQLANDIFNLSTPIISSFGTKSCKNVFKNKLNYSSSYKNINSNNLGSFFYEKLIKELQKESGDGISTSILIFNQILKKGLVALKEGKKTQILQKELQEGASLISSFLQAISQPIDNIDKLKNISHTASFQDDEITEIVCNTLGQIGNEDFIFIEKSNELSSFIEINSGICLQQGYAHSLFVSDPIKLRTFLENPYILISNINITSIQDVLMLLKKLPEKKLLIICENMSSQILSMLITNRLKGLINVVVTKTLKNPYFTEETLQNISLLTGGRIFFKENNDSINNCLLKDLGRCSRIEISSTTTTIINNKILENNNNFTFFNENKHLNNKPFNLIGTIFVGASKETELLSKQLKISSSIKSTQTALKKGFILGGGVGLYHAANKILQSNTPSKNSGINILYQSCLFPLKKILSNNVMHTHYKKLLNEISNCKKQQLGFNRNTLTLDNLLEAGIFDSTQIVINSILKATEIACEIFSCDVLIEEYKKTTYDK